MTIRRKLLYLDLFPTKAHTTLNKIFITNLKEFINVDVFTQKNYFKSEEFNGLIEYKALNIKHLSRLTIRIRSIYIIIQSIFLFRKKKYDYIFIPTFETITFAIYSILGIDLDKFHIVHHLNIDELKFPFKKLFFKLYMNKVNHIVFEEYFKKYLIKEIGIKENLVAVIHHPLMPINISLNTMGQNSKLCVGLSNSNLENLIDEIIEIENKEKILERGNAYLVLKSKFRNYESKHLKVIIGHLPIDTYNTYIDQSSMILMLHSENHIYRASGFLYDGLSNRKVVIGNNVRILNEYSLKFPIICRVGFSVKEILEIIVNSSINSEANTQFDQFISQYSDRIFIAQLKGIFID